MIDFNVKNFLSKSGKKLNTRALEKITKEEILFLEKSIPFLKYNKKNISEFIFCYVNNIEEPIKCAMCDNTVMFKCFTIGYPTHCSIICGRNNKKTKEKIENTSRNNPDIWKNAKEKTRKTNMEKYGVEIISQSPLIKQKIKETNLERYGVENCYHTVIAKKKAKTTHQKHAPESFLILDDAEKLKNLYEKYSIIQIGDLLNVAHHTVYLYLKKHNIDTNNWKNISNKEQDVFNFIKSIYNGKVEQSNRKLISPFELDIYIPEKKLAIEFNGVYWHSSVDNSMNDYHLTKTEMCEKQGVQLLHIFENEWNSKQDIWKSLIANKLGICEERIFARKCEVGEIPLKEAKDFFDKTHLQGKLQHGNALGLYYKDELVSCIAYGNSRFEKDTTEIFRFSNKLNMMIVGGFSKLFSKIKYDGKIVSYANRRWSTGNLYEKCGFDFVSKSMPNYFIVDKINNDWNLLSRQQFQKHKLKDHHMITLFDETKTERENLMLNNIRKIYDAGNLKYQYQQQT